jgi:hypothetical protein
MYQVELIISSSLILKFCLIDVPGSPRNPQVDSVSDESVALSWQPPEDDGGSFITNYVVEKLDPDTGKWVRAATSRAPRCTVDNLIPNKPYQFRIIAQNNLGSGEPSEPTKTVQTKGKII